MGADAALAVQYGADGVIVSNHGARATDTGRGTIECLPEVVSAVNGRIPVIVDGGIRRGTDVFKALALRCLSCGNWQAVLLGPGSLRTAGVERVLDLLNRELGITMRGSGTASIASRSDLTMYRMPGKVASRSSGKGNTVVPISADSGSRIRGSIGPA